MARKAVLLVLCLMFLPMTAFGQGSEDKDGVAKTEVSAEISDGVRTTLKNYLKAFEAKDIEGIMAVFADAPNTVMMGTGPEEVWLGKEAIRMAHNAFLASSDKETSKETVVSIDTDGNVSWLTGYLDVTSTDSEGMNTSQINLSIVLKKIDSIWFISAMHFSHLTSP